jgi:DNA-binding NtrC family response regulator
VRLLQFLETGDVQPLGASGPPRHVDVRVIAATSANLTHLAHSGVFREDFLYRLGVAHIHLPALRDRPADIAALVAHTIAKTGRAVRFSDQALALLTGYHWPGNVRELQTTVEQLVCMTGESVIDVQHLPVPMRTPGRRVVSMVERRRQLADDLYAGLVARTISFWSELYPLFLSRDVTRHDLREVLRRGLRTTAGSYRALIPLFGMELHDYKRLLNFLAAHDCNVDPRPFRKRPAGSAAGESFAMAMVDNPRKAAAESRVERSSAET